MPAKLDLYQTHKKEYATPREPVLLEVGPARYLAVAGAGAPGAPGFVEAIGALYAVAFTMKMAFKRKGRDYAVSKLEGLWWGPPGHERDFMRLPPARWEWDLLIRTPDFVASADVERTCRELRAKGKPATVETVRLEKLAEGRCVQVLHVGPYSAEPATIAAMLAFARARGLEPAGRHHEIYLSDPRRVAAERLRTILRQPVTAGSN